MWLNSSGTGTLVVTSTVLSPSSVSSRLDLSLCVAMGTCLSPCWQCTRVWWWGRTQGSSRALERMKLAIKRNHANFSSREQVSFYLYLDRRHIILRSNSIKQFKFSVNKRCTCVIYQKYSGNFKTLTQRNFANSNNRQCHLLTTVFDSSLYYINQLVNNLHQEPRL